MTETHGGAFAQEERRGRPAIASGVVQIKAIWVFRQASVHVILIAAQIS